MNTKLTINEKITDLRVQAGLSQKELCAAIGIPASSLSRIERGEITNVSNDILVKLAKYFRVSTDYLLGMTKVTTAKNAELRRSAQWASWQTRAGWQGHRAKCRVP